jgi:hypothetical protein
MGVVRLPLIVITRGSVGALPGPFALMLSKNRKGLEVRIKSLQPTVTALVVLDDL